MSKPQLVCAYEYADGICGVSEDSHKYFAGSKILRNQHTFTGAEIRRSMDAEVDADGVARFVRPLKAGQTYVVDGSVLDAIMNQHPFDDRPQVGRDLDANS
jgi:hypothetical protein